MTCVDFELLFNGIEVYRMVEMVMKVSVLDVTADKKLMILCVILMSDKYNAISISLQYNPGKALVDMQHLNCRACRTLGFCSGRQGTIA